MGCWLAERYLRTYTRTYEYIVTGCIEQISENYSDKLISSSSFLNRYQKAQIGKFSKCGLFVQYSLLPPSPNVDS